MDEFPWTTDMFVVIGEGIVKAAPWGLMARVLIGAVTSTVDLGTDIFVAYMFWKDDRMEFFELTLGSLLLSMIMQLYTIVGQNKNLGAKKMIIEALPVFFGLKPAGEVEQRLERSDSKSITRTSYTKNNVPLVSPLLTPARSSQWTPTALLEV